MSDEHKTNGDGGAAPASVTLPHVIITVTDLANMKLEIGGAFPSLDYGLNMLEQARRELEAQWRLQRAAEYQKQAMLAAQADAIRRDLAGRR